MTVIVLAGLVAIEKAELSLELSRHSLQQGHSVTIIDNIARRPIESDHPEIVLQRIEGNLLTDFAGHIAATDTDMTIIAISEQVHPEKLFIALDDARQAWPDHDIYSLALIDTRTCDCFPNVRQALEMYADASVMLPYELDEVLAYVAPA